MRRIWPWGVVVALAALCLILGGALLRKPVGGGHPSASRSDLRDQVDSLRTRLDVCRRETDSLGTRLASFVDFPMQRGYSDALRERGLKDPVPELIEDLQRHPEVIPHPGVLGGRMGFYDRDRIRVLNDSWVYAGFDDGHVVGDGIFGYQVAPGGRISWRVVVSRLR